MRGLDLDVRFRDAGLDDAAALSKLGRDTFIETFGRAYTPSDLGVLLDDVFSTDRQTAEISDPDVSIRVAEAKRALVGYALLGPDTLGLEVASRPALELRRIYVRGDRQGVGVGRILLTWTINTARDRGAEDLVLAVWRENARAIALYESRGFETCGSAPFHVGAQTGENILMRKRLDR